MAPPNLQGLNIVHPTIQTDNHDLLAGQQYSDLSAQLDLWTNLTFDSEEPIVPTTRPNNNKNFEEEEEARSPVTTEKAVHDGHVNVVTGTNIGTNDAHRHDPNPLPPLDLNQFLVGFGIDPFSLIQPQQQLQPIAPSLAQLLAFHSTAVGAQHQFGVPQPQFQSQPILPPSQPAYQPPAAPSPESAPSTKRARTRKASVSISEADVESPSASSPATSVAEDKRRRNTAASARFRLKKKEREAALEGKAKELELKVSELERECEGLRRENGWLKGLVVGVTGAAQGPVPPLMPPPSHLPAPQNVSSSGTKRRRDDDSL